MEDYNEFLYGKKANKDKPEYTITKENTLYKFFLLEMIYIYYSGNNGEPLDLGKLRFPEGHGEKAIMMYKIQDCINKFIEKNKDETSCISNFKKFAVDYDKEAPKITNEKGKILLMKAEGSELEPETFITFTGFLERFSKCLDRLLAGGKETNEKILDIILKDFIKELTKDMENKQIKKITVQDKVDMDNIPINVSKWGKYSRVGELFSQDDINLFLFKFLPDKYTEPLKQKTGIQYYDSSKK
jgi:hypothetical protein